MGASWNTRTWGIPLALAAAFGGCTCRSKPASEGSLDASPNASASAAASAAPSASASSPSADRPPPPIDVKSVRLSAPLAAAVQQDGTTFVAGLAVPTGTIVLTKVTPAGEGAFTADALTHVAWTADADLRLFPGPDAVAVLWRGQRSGKAGRTLVILDGAGHPRGEPIEIGASACAYAEGVLWIDRVSRTASRVRLRGWGGEPARDVLSSPGERELGLVCGERAAYVLSRDDDQLSAIPITGGVPRPAMVAIRDDDFGDDDEQQHQAYAFDEGLGLLRVGGSGAISVRTVVGDKVSPWRRLKHKLRDDEDVVALDGDGASLTLVTTRDEGDRCPNGAESIHALRADLASGEESVAKLAPAECGREAGPYWVAGPTGRPTVAWVERGKRAGDSQAPIRGLAYRRIGAAEAGGGPLIRQPADALVEAGCAGATCFAAALVREPDQDGMSAEPVRLLRFP